VWPGVTLNPLIPFFCLVVELVRVVKVATVVGSGRGGENGEVAQAMAGRLWWEAFLYSLALEFSLAVEGDR